MKKIFTTLLLTIIGCLTYSPGYNIGTCSKYKKLVIRAGTEKLFSKNEEVEFHPLIFMSIGFK